LNKYKIDLGCGDKKFRPDYIGIDIVDFGQEIVRDIRKGLPFEDNTASAISAKHVLEHFAHDEIIFILNECHRVLEKGGKMYIEVPAYTDPSAYSLRHKTIFSNETIQELDREDNENRYGIKRWQIEELTVKTNRLYAWLTPVK
jgi:SAM-dependent methyltransferase